jgi:hypothetical protein
LSKFLSLILGNSIFSELLRTPSHQTLERRQAADDLAPIGIARLPVPEENEEVEEHDVGQVELNENANFSYKSSLQRITRRDLNLVLANSTPGPLPKNRKRKLQVETVPLSSGWLQLLFETLSTEIVPTLQLFHSPPKNEVVFHSQTYLIFSYLKPSKCKYQVWFISETN